MVTCLYCKNPAVKLLFYSKNYLSGKNTIETPIFCCEECTDKAKADLSICRGGIESIKIYTFKQLGAMKENEIAYLVANKPYEINHLATKYYKELLFKIHYINKPSKKDKLKEYLIWYKKILSKNHEDNLQLVNSIDTILEHLKS